MGFRGEMVHDLADIMVFQQEKILIGDLEVYFEVSWALKGNKGANWYLKSGYFQLPVSRKTSSGNPKLAGNRLRPPPTSTRAAVHMERQPVCVISVSSERSIAIVYREVHTPTSQFNYLNFMLEQWWCWQIRHACRQNERMELES